MSYRFCPICHLHYYDLNSHRLLIDGEYIKVCKKCFDHNTSENQCPICEFEISMAVDDQDD